MVSVPSHPVCRSWFIAATNETRRNKPCTPLLLLAGESINENSEYRTIFSLPDNKTYCLPQIRGRRCLGTADPWLVTVDNVAELHLFNPFTGTEYDLPSITTLPIIPHPERDANGSVTGYMIHSTSGGAEPWFLLDLEYMLERFHHRAVIFAFASDDNPSSITVFIIRGPSDVR